MSDPTWLPALLFFDANDVEGSITRAYLQFCQDFETEAARPMFQGRRLGLKRYPKVEGRSATFWHWISEGENEATRVPVPARIERIPWPRPIIVEAASRQTRVRIWANERGGATRWLLALDDFSYLVVLEDRQTFLLPWTAYPVARTHSRNKLRREYESWCMRQKS